MRRSKLWAWLLPRLFGELISSFLSSAVPDSVRQMHNEPCAYASLARNIYIAGLRPVKYFGICHADSCDMNEYGQSCYESQASEMSP